MKSAVILGAAAAAVSAAPLIAAPDGAQVVPGEYIVRLSERFDGQMIKNHVNKVKTAMGNQFEAKHIYNTLAGYGFSAYSAKLSPEALTFLKEHSEVVSIEANQIAHVNECVSQTNPEWGLTRVNIKGANTPGAPYYYSTTTGAGAGVDAYIIDSGIYCENVEFTNKLVGSCTYGIDLIDGSNVDGNGHGTHVAGTTAGYTYGVAKEANLIAVRVMNDKGSGSYDDIIAGVDWVVQKSKETGRPSVSNMSIGGSVSTALNDAVNAAVDANVAIIVAAGNNNANACNYSPASASKAITVGATDIKDYRASYSNYGKCLDLFGPGSDIKSAYIGSPTATAVLSGTSMASPHVCGTAAKYLSANPALTAYEVNNKLIGDATKDQVINEDGGNPLNTNNQSPDLIVYGNC